MNLMVPCGFSSITQCPEFGTMPTATLAATNRSSPPRLGRRVQMLQVAKSGACTVKRPRRAIGFDEEMLDSRFHRGFEERGKINPALAQIGNFTGRIDVLKMHQLVATRVFLQVLDRISARLGGV